VLLLLRAAWRVGGLSRTGRGRALYGRLSGEGGLERAESFERGVAIRLGGFIAGAIRAIARGEKLEERVRRLEGDQLRLAGSADQLLAGERRVADQGLERRLGAGSQIDDVGSEIFGRARSLEVSENGANPVQCGER